MPINNGDTVLMEGVRIVFRNFEGAEGQYNRKGDRNFAVLLDDDIADRMASDGWNVKLLKAREEEDTPQPYLPVTVSFKGRPPTIAMVTSRGRTLLGEDECEVLDWADIRNVDLIVRAYSWGPINGKSGVKAYLKSIYVTINEDELDLKYGDLEQVPGRSSRVEEG